MGTENHTGHPVNVMNLEKLIAFLVEMGAVYDPVNDRIKIPALGLMLISANGTLQLVKDTSSTFDRSTNDREIEFKDIKKLATRLVNALIGCGATKLTVADAKTINRKIQGGRKAAKIIPPPTETVVPTDETANLAKNISVSQQNVDFVIDNFNKLVTLLLNEPLYIPNEVDLQTQTMLAKIVRMKAVNSKVIKATPPYISAMLGRDVVLYKEDVGLIDTTKVIKSYCLSVLGSDSELYKKINHLAFRNF